MSASLSLRFAVEIRPLHEGLEGGSNPISPAHIFSKSRFPALKHIYPNPIMTFFSHPQCPNPSACALNPTFPGQQKANPSSHFTPSGPSYTLVWDQFSVIHFLTDTVQQII